MPEPQKIANLLQAAQRADVDAEASDSEDEVRVAAVFSTGLVMFFFDEARVFMIFVLMCLSFEILWLAVLCFHDNLMIFWYFISFFTIYALSCWLFEISWL